ENLLQWSRLQTGSIECNRKNINPLSILEQCLKTLYSNSALKNINIIKNIDPAIQAFADPDMTRLIFRNLISNAIKFTGEGGEIQIDSKHVENFVEIAVSDNGTGIKVEDISKLFKIEQKHSIPGTSNETGTGLGLILCKEFVDQNNGEIWVESEVDHGSVFKFTLPVPLKESRSNL
ncbi:MAG: HAMP domain-containing sensor histidine kinase, partial [Thermodesulfobacteriota bacterium]|nr:HAMP domain-containing sensor histidine kinase [Thermodesulfobacteriota bacterium]